MKFAAIIGLLVVFTGICHGTERKEEREHFKLDERTKEILLKEKSKVNVFFEKMLEFFLENPNRDYERECFSKLKPDESVDFVIDLAPSPSQDEVDKRMAESPIALYYDVMGLRHQQRSPSRSYFEPISMFIDKVTYDMKPEATYSIIYDNGEKYYIRGKTVEAPVTQALSSQGGDFSDSVRNLKTMWPSSTKSTPESPLHRVLKNNLGHLTSLALWNRNNGLPSVLGSSRRGKSVYTVVITDGSSGAKIHDLVDDLSRTTVIDIGNRRFVKNLKWDELRSLSSVVNLMAPQQLGTVVDTCRLWACRFCC